MAFKVIDIPNFTVFADNSLENVEQADFASVQEAFNKYAALRNAGMKPLLICNCTYEEQNEGSANSHIGRGDILLRDGGVHLEPQQIGIEYYSMKALRQYYNIRSYLRNATKINYGDTLRAPRCAPEVVTKQQLESAEQAKIPIVVDLGFTKLVAEEIDEELDDGICEKGVVLGMYDSHGDWQDIAMVSTEILGKKLMHPEAGKVKCLVWADSTTEDYTNRFVIDQY